MRRGTYPVTSLLRLDASASVPRKIATRENMNDKLLKMKNNLTFELPFTTAKLKNEPGGAAGFLDGVLKSGWNPSGGCNHPMNVTPAMRAEPAKSAFNLFVSRL